MGDEGKKPEDTRRRPMVVSKGWVQGIVLVMILGFTVMGILAYHTYNDSIPIPDKVVSTTGEVLFTHDDIVAGQEAFNNRGLMEYGSMRPRWVPWPRLHRRLSASCRDVDPGCSNQS